MNLEMSIEEMISALDTAAGMLLVASMNDVTVREAMEKITDVSLALGELGEKLEEN
jgi:hypothetical protein